MGPGRPACCLLDQGVTCPAPLEGTKQTPHASPAQRVMAAYLCIIVLVGNSSNYCHLGAPLPVNANHAMCRVHQFKPSSHHPW